MTRAPICCPKCHQPLRTERFGVPMPPLKARIFDAVKAAGDSGISTRELFNVIYESARAPRSIATVRTHILMINDLLEETDLRIVCTGRSKYALWSLVRRPRTLMAVA
jgi:hypothetical protein